MRMRRVRNKGKVGSNRQIYTLFLPVYGIALGLFVHLACAAGRLNGWFAVFIAAFALNGIFVLTISLRNRIVVSDGGIVVVERGREQVLSWADVERVHKAHQRARPVYIFEFKGASFRVRTAIPASRQARRLIEQNHGPVELEHSLLDALRRR